MKKKNKTKKIDNVEYLTDQLILHLDVHNRVLSELMIAMQKLREELVRK